MLDVQEVRLASLAPSRLVWLATRPSADAGRVASPCLVLACRPSSGSDMDTFLIHILNSLLYASVLFLIAGGLSLIYGVMRIVNLAHGNLYAFGAYATAWAVGRMLGPSTQASALLYC